MYSISNFSENVEWKKLNFFHILNGPLYIKAYNIPYTVKRGRSIIDGRLWVYSAYTSVGGRDRTVLQCLQQALAKSNACGLS